MERSVKHIILVYTDGTFKGYNMNAFREVFGIKLNEHLKR